MKELLKTSTKRRLALIEQLRDSFGWQDVQTISATLGCTVKTVLSDVSAINHTWQGKVGIEYSNSKGLRLDDSEDNKFQLLSSTIMEESEEFLFLDKLFFEPTKDADYWINELFISEATFYRMVRQLDKVLKRQGLQLERKPFRITAENERWVRIFYQNFLFEKYGVENWPFTFKQSEALTFISKSSSTFDLLLTDREKIQYAYFLAISLIRNSQGFELTKPLKESPTSLQTELLQQLAKQIALPLQRTWQNEVLTGLFYDQNLTARENSELVEKLRNFLSELENTFGIVILAIDQKRLIQVLLQIYHRYEAYPNQQTILFDAAKSFSHFAQRNYPHFVKLVWQLLLQLESETNFPWYQFFRYNVLHELFKNWNQLARGLDVLSPKVSILIVSDSGQRHGEMLAELLQNRFYYRLKIQLYEESIFTLRTYEAFDTYDLVISNYLLKAYPFDNLLLIDDYFSEIDLYKVSQIVKKTR